MDEIARPIPMKRELKDEPQAMGHDGNLIARPIPMKRELKADQAGSWRDGGSCHRKAHPDEKGTERGGN